jgi:hypothetical protein
MRALRRREFLALGAGLLAGLAAPRRARAAVPTRDPVARLFAHPDSARIVGRRYLEAFPQRAERARLEADCVNRVALAADADATAWREALAALRRREFADGETVVLDGWVLARSEASLCALLALR